MSTLRTFNLQNPDSGTVNIEMDQGGNTLMTGIATVRGAAHFTSTSGSDAVGIGTDITAYKLDVRVTGAETGLRVYNPDTSSNASGILRLGNDDNQNAAFLRLNGSNNTSAVGGAGSLVLGHGLSKNLHLSTAGASRLNITSAGLVGVNCTPLSQFQVKTGTNQNIALSSMSSEASIEAYNDAGSANVPLRLRASAHKFFIGSTEGFRVHTNGLIGVGYDSPTAYGRMTVAMPSQSGGAAIQVANSSNGSGDGSLSNIVLRSVNNGGNNWADAEYRASQHIFAIQGSEKVRISSGGLAINKNSAADTEIEILQSADPTLRLYDTRNSAYKADFIMAGSGPVIRNNNTTASDRTLTVQKGLTDHLVIEGSGCVRKPLQPSFYVGGGFSLTSWNSNKHANWVDATTAPVFDTNNDYANGVFTAPVDGKYYFSASFLTGSGAGFLLWAFYKNTSKYQSGWFQVYDDSIDSNNECQLTGSIIMDMSAGDTARVAINNTHDNVYTTSYNYFLGYLIG